MVNVYDLSSPSIDFLFANRVVQKSGKHNNWSTDNLFVDQRPAMH